MSSERTPEPNHAFFDGLSFESKQSIVSDVELEIEQKLLALEDAFLECQDHSEHIALKTRADLLSDLMVSTLLMAKYETAGHTLCLEDIAEQMLAYNSTDWSTGDTIDQTAEEALRRGIMEGTNDLLEILAPDHIASEGFKEVYFMPWRFDFFYRKHQAHPETDGTVSWNLNTRLPNIAINYHYTPESNTPRRTIFYIGEQ